jgi:hypothetical protein
MRRGEYLPALAQWPGLQSVIAVETIRTAHQHAPVTSDYRFYLSSLERSATAFVTMIRQHWDIENKLHWSLCCLSNNFSFFRLINFLLACCRQPVERVSTLWRGIGPAT